MYQKTQETVKGPRGTKRSERYLKVQEVPKGPRYPRVITNRKCKERCLYEDEYANGDDDDCLK